MGGWSVARLAPDRGRLGLGRLLSNRIRCTSLGIFCTVSLCICRVVTALSDRFKVGGPLPCQQRSSFNPARPSTARQPVKCPLYARAIDIFGAALIGAATAPCRLPVSCSCLKHPVSNISSRLMNLAIKPVTWLALSPASSQSGAYERSLPSPAPGT